MREYLFTYVGLMAIYMGLVSLDSLTTVAILVAGGLEANPIIAFFIEHYGLAKALHLKALLNMGSATLLTTLFILNYPRFDRQFTLFVSAALVFMTAVPVASNLGVLLAQVIVG